VIHAAGATIVLGRADVRRLLAIRECIDAVEHAFQLHAAGRTVAPGVLGAHVDGGGFHVKTAGLRPSSERAGVFAMKINANFPGNPKRHGLPTIQGVIALFDATNGRVLALLDSIEITSARTAAATALAAKYLARIDARVVTVCGCGEQGRSQLRAILCVRPVQRVNAYDIDRGRAESYADEMSSELGMPVGVVDQLGEPTYDSDIWITCTPAHRWFLGRGHVRPGAFIAAVGADNGDKQEIEPELLASNVVIADVLDQCVSMGDLHHALDAGVMRRDSVRAELAEIVGGTKLGRLTDNEIIVFDSTGTALEDVAAAALVYERALRTGVGVGIDLGSRMTHNAAAMI
jgi:ornithine cyclodeaminase/alanine dehydrogenase-like protein (mu-crystallin family)